MIVPTRGKILCEEISRERKLPSGIWLADRIKSEKKDNICRCIGVGDGVKTARRTDIIHYKRGFGNKLTWNGKKLISIKADEILAIEREGKIIAPGSSVIARLVYRDTIRSIIVPDSAKTYNGDYYGEVISVGPDYPDKSLKAGDKIIYLRNEGYTFKTHGTREELISIQEKWIGGKI